jgi:hypothetical protein
VTVAGSLHVLTPGLLGPMPPEAATRIRDDLAGRPRLASLERLLARADRLSAPAGSLPALLAAFGVKPESDQDLPSAPFCRLADAPSEQSEGYWLHADPVHLRADRDRVRLFDSSALDVTAAEAEELVGLFNSHFGASALRLIAPRPSRWYLHLRTPPRLRTTPLDEVAGQWVEPFLPRGDDAVRWSALLNEAQMLLHGADVNRRREAERRPTVNAIWLWGGGVLPPAPAAPPFASVHGSAPIARGLARWAGSALGDDADGLPSLSSEEGIRDRLVHWDLPQKMLRAGDMPPWLEAASTLDTWLEALRPAISRGRLGALILDPCCGTAYRNDRRTDRRFWRRRSALQSCLCRGAIV